ncbi:MAG: hypothetical protein ACYDCK_00605 [Thermoplasmatota archaeon]
MPLSCGERDGIAAQWDASRRLLVLEFRPCAAADVSTFDTLDAFAGTFAGTEGAYGVILGCAALASPPATWSTEHPRVPQAGWTRFRIALLDANEPVLAFFARYSAATHVASRPCASREEAETWLRASLAILGPSGA